MESTLWPLLHKSEKKPSKNKNAKKILNADSDYITDYRIDEPPNRLSRHSETNLKKKKNLNKVVEDSTFFTQKYLV